MWKIGKWNNNVDRTKEKKMKNYYSSFCDFILFFCLLFLDAFAQFLNASKYAKERFQWNWSEMFILENCISMTFRILFQVHRKSVGKFTIFFLIFMEFFCNYFSIA